MPKYLRNLNVDRNVLNTLELKCGNKDFDPLSSKSKIFYAFLIQEKAKHSRGFYKIMSDFNLSEKRLEKRLYWQNQLLLKHLYNVFFSKF